MFLPMVKEHESRLASRACDITEAKNDCDLVAPVVGCCARVDPNFKPLCTPNNTPLGKTVWWKTPSREFLLSTNDHSNTAKQFLPSTPYRDESFTLKPCFPTFFIFLFCSRRKKTYQFSSHSNHEWKVLNHRTNLYLENLFYFKAPINVLCNFQWLKRHFLFLFSLFQKKKGKKEKVQLLTQIVVIWFYSPSELRQMFSTSFCLPF